MKRTIQRDKDNRSIRTESAHCSAALDRFVVLLNDRELTSYSGFDDVCRSSVRSVSCPIHSPDVSSSLQRSIPQLLFRILWNVASNFPMELLHQIHEDGTNVAAITSSASRSLHPRKECISTTRASVGITSRFPEAGCTRTAFTGTFFAGTAFHSRPTTVQKKMSQQATGRSASLKQIYLCRSSKNLRQTQSSQRKCRTNLRCVMDSTRTLQ